MKHQHKYDANGKQLCCTLEEKINQETDIEIGCCAVDSKSEHSDDDGHDHEQVDAALVDGAVENRQDEERLLCRGLRAGRRRGGAPVVAAEPAAL